MRPLDLVISTVQEVAFDYSAKKLHAFFDEREAGAATKENMEKRTKLRTLCEMRWTSRADALYTFKTSYRVQTDSPCRSANSISITVLDSLMTSRRSHSVSWRNVDK
jgi:hypothetical protein